MNEKEMKYKIEKLEQRIEGLEIELDYQMRSKEKLVHSHGLITELQEAVAKLANQPVGMMFDYRA